MGTMKRILGWVVFIAALLFVFSMDDSCEVRQGKVKPWPWEQFKSSKP
jgi:hypothetical protein